MSARTKALADELTSRFVAIDGIRAIFPEHAAAAAVLAIVGGGVQVGGTVRVAEAGESVTISARLATDRAVPTRRVIADAVAAIAAAVGARPYELELEFAVID